MELPKRGYIFEEMYSRGTENMKIRPSVSRGGEVFIEGSFSRGGPKKEISLGKMVLFILGGGKNCSSPSRQGKKRTGGDLETSRFLLRENSQPKKTS